MKNNVKARSSPPRFKNRRKHNSGGKNVNKSNKEQVKFQTITKVASPEIGSSNSGTMTILQRSPARSPVGLVNGKQSPTPSPVVLDNLCPPLVNKDGASSPEPTQQQMVGGKSYAGSRFHTPPRPDLLPKPPTHWIGCNLAMARFANQSFMNMHLKGLLKVQA